MSEEATATPGGDGGEVTPTESPSYFSEGTNTFADGWTENLGEGYESLSKFNGKGVDDLARSYTELEKKIGAKTEGMVKVPGEDATDEELRAFHASLGVPDSPDAYEIELPEESLEGIDWDPESLGPIKEAAQKAGVSPKQLNGLVEAQLEIEKAAAEQWNQDQEQARAELRKEWGANADKNSTYAERAMEAGGLDPESPLASHPDVLRMAAALGAKISEGSIDPIESKSAGKTASDEARDIQLNPENPMYKLYRGEGPREKVAEVRKRVEELNALASK